MEAMGQHFCDQFASSFNQNCWTMCRTTKVIKINALSLPSGSTFEPFIYSQYLKFSIINGYCARVSMICESRIVMNSAISMHLAPYAVCYFVPRFEQPNRLFI